MTKKATAGKKAKAPKAEKVVKAKADSAETKASEVIAAVPIALLEAHPSLPSGDAWLRLFAEHYKHTASRHAALEAASAPAPEPEPVKASGKKGRSPFVPPTLPSARPTIVAHEPLPDLSWSAPAAQAAHDPEPEPETLAEVEPEVLAPEPEVEQEAEAEPEFDLFAQLAAEEKRIEDPDDFLARLQAQGEAAVDGRPSMFEEVDFAKTLPSDQSSPFIVAHTGLSSDHLDEQTTMIAALPDEDEGTAMIAAMPDDVSADELPEDDTARYAEPSDSTMMIAAITDEELENLTAPGEDGAAPKAGRKSRKASKKKKG